MRCLRKTILILLGSLSLIPAQGVKNFIYVVPDGYGIASQVLARDYLSLSKGISTEDNPHPAAFGVDSMVIGSVRTHSLNERITDSAAAATAFACAIKTNNGVIGLTKDNEPQGSILEAAHLAGMKTGLVATSRITHATPAGYSAHVRKRDQEADIAAQQIGKTHPFGPFVDLLMGGGREYYLSQPKGGKRTDGIDLTSWAVEKGGYNYVHNKESLNKFARQSKVPLPFLGLFALGHMHLEIDRKRVAPLDEPSLLEMTQIAIATLWNATKEAERGFFIMIEASRIDHAGHDNDPAAHIQDVLMYNEVMSYLKDFVDAHPDTQLLSAADHECGGLTLKDGYNPLWLDRVMAQSVSRLVDRFESSDHNSRLEILFHEIDRMIGRPGFSSSEKKNIRDAYKEHGADRMKATIGRAFSKRAGIAWSTYGHSAVDTLLHGHASPEGLVQMKKEIGGNIDNTDIPRYIEKVLDLRMRNATALLRRAGKDWIDGK